jgi:hypothetical protein
MGLVNGSGSLPLFYLRPATRRRKLPIREVLITVIDKREHGQLSRAAASPRGESVGDARSGSARLAALCGSG